MFIYKLSFVLFLFIFQEYDCERRIQNGLVVKNPKKYVVYLVKASISPKFYSGWLCGGALVSSSLIVTSAACVTDVIHLYAVAGYSKYVKEEEINKNVCTKEKKKKVVLICVPQQYEFSYQNQAKWTFMDIAVVKVESPYNFNDESFTEICSYIPAPITINYDSKYQEPGIDAILLGWGHYDKYRQHPNIQNYNKVDMHYATTLIIDKATCKNAYNIYEGMDKVIDTYMICTDGVGNLDENGEMLIKPLPTAQGCSQKQLLLGKMQQLPCDKVHENVNEIENENENENEYLDDEQVLLSRKLRRPANVTNNDSAQNSTKINKRNNSVTDANSTIVSSLPQKNKKTVLKGTPTRRNGICQNDHGGPLVTWVGAHEALIGVASAYKITKTFDCVGPYLFTSTQCSGAFLDCVIREDNAPTGRREICANLTQMGYKVHERNISWADHPDGPADNEKHLTKHVSPANSDTNATVDLKNSKEGNNVKEENNDSMILVKTNVTDTLGNASTTKAEIVGNSTPINLANASSVDAGTTKAETVANSIPINLANASAINVSTTKAETIGSSTSINLSNTSSIDVKKTARVILTRATSTNLVNRSFTNLTDTQHAHSISTKSQLHSSANNIESTKTPILIKNATIATTNLETSTASVIVNASLTRTINLVDTILKNSSTSVNQAYNKTIN
ncbi:hypothetical protein PYW08_009671 [Mythimna loreyi]|uniref:Uncharacterized protein n=1 Tax=Mythimna loreyi TaxID=667449 RepID=A0ACC2Q719_9NEOP|nr:hypothetical protein PYW08_009671 [Mythimna loreyi]